MAKKHINQPPKVCSNLSATKAQTKLNEALALHQRGQLSQAQGLYEEILNTYPKQADCLHLLGVIAYQTRNHQRGLELISKAIALSPNDASFYSNQGLVLKELNLLDAAISSFDKAIALQPGYAEAYNNRGNVLKELKRLEDAIASYDQAIALKENNAEAYNNRGVTLQEMKRWDAAIESFGLAIASRADFAEAYSNRGIVFKELNQPERAIECYDKAIALKPGYAEAHSNRGNALKELKLLDAALSSYDHAIALKPDYAEAHWNKSLALLLGGELKKGWQEYEWRWQYDSFTSPRRKFAQPLWLGKESLIGKSILIHCEQGLGDTIQFCRYAARVAELGARVVMEVPGILAGLLKGLEGVDEWVVTGNDLPDFDFHCPLLSLPLAFATTLDNIPSAQAYLQAEPEKIKQWKNHLGPETRPRVGLAWSGRPDHKNDHNRSITLENLLPYLPSGLDYFSLQKEVRDTDLATLERQNLVKHYGDSLTDFTDTAALCALMDIVLCVDTSVAHLAGALGKPTWILLPFRPDWRWLLDRSDCPWYPSVHLYRQTNSRDWLGVFKQVREQLLRHESLT